MATFMEWLFGKRVTPQERLEKNKVDVRDAITRLSTERMSYQVKLSIAQRQADAISAVKQAIAKREALTEVVTIQRTISVINKNMERLRVRR